MDGPLAPQCQRCPSRREEDINTASATSPQRRTYTITAPPGEQRAQGGGAGGLPRHNTDTLRRRAGHRHCLISNSGDRTIAAPGNNEREGEARAPPVDTKCGTARGEGRRCEWSAAGGMARHPAERDTECAAAGGGGGRPAPAARRGPARTCDHPPRPKYDSPPSCRKKRWAEFKAQSSPSPSSSLEATAAAAVTPSYSPQRSRGDCHRRCRGNRVHRAVPLPHRSVWRGVHATEGRRPHEARAGG